VRRRKDREEDVFAGLGGESSLKPVPSSGRGEGDGDELDEFPDTSPSRANVLAMLAIADEETDLDQAEYYVRRAIAEELLLICDGLADRSGNRGG
jgi:hypothetical protein